MKKKLLFYSIATLISLEANAQLNPTPGIPVLPGFDPCNFAGIQHAAWTSEAEKLYSRCSFVKVGVGTHNPTHAFHVALDARFGQAKVDYNIGIGDEPKAFSKLHIKNPTQDAAIEINQSGNNKAYQKMILFQYTHPTTEILKAYHSETGAVSYLFEASGKMTVSNGTHKIFQLKENGLLRVRNVRIDTEVWPDYVFKPSYQLMPLAEVERFIGEKGHLPNIPSEKEVLEEGVDVAGMNVKMLEKIEELTLYLIEQEKQIQELKKEISILNNNK